MNYLLLILIAFFTIVTPISGRAGTELMGQPLGTNEADPFEPFIGEYQVIRVDSATQGGKPSKDTTDHLIIGRKNDTDPFLTLQIWYGPPDAGLRFSQPLTAGSATISDGKWSRTIAPVSGGLKYTRQTQDREYHTVDEFTFRKGENEKLFLQRMTTWKYYREPKPVIFSSELVLEKRF